MPRTAVLFTGQGAQSVGMGRDIAAASPAAAALFDRANDIVGYDLKTLCFEGPAEKLEQTDIQQPAIFTTSAAIWKALNDGRGLDDNVVAMAGLSLGEYTALYAGGALSFEDALQLVQRRGQLMQAAAVQVPSGMVTIIGMDPPAVEAICEKAGASGYASPANFNCPGQIVVSGDKAGCEAVLKLAEEAGGRAVPLKVAGAFHSRIMQPAADGLGEKLKTTPFSALRVPVIANVNCEYHRDADTMRLWLTEQLTNPVRWQGCVERLIGEGVEQFIEIGPGRVLSGLLRKIARGVPITAVNSAADLSAAGAAAS